MFCFAAISALLLASTSVQGLVIPRDAPPVAWDTDLLEDYNTYHTRYLTLGCPNEHRTPFFESCCHPLLANESLSSRPQECRPSPFTSSSATVDGSSLTNAFTRSTTNYEAKGISGSTNGGSIHNGGVATWFIQNGIAGACGKVHRDSDLIAALDYVLYGDAGQRSLLCGKEIEVTNVNNGKTVKVTVADDCPTCSNSNSLDLSEGAFKVLADLSLGELPITWKFL